MSVVEYEVRDRIGYIALNRPDKLNAINREVREGLYRALVDVRDNPDVWVAIITGRGRAFCAGRDLKEMAEGEASGPPTEELYYLESHIWKPVLAAVNGVCIAQGCGLALSADIRIAAEGATFGWPQVKRGISSISGPVILAQRIPLGLALEVLFRGGFLTAQRAQELGLVNQVVPSEQVLPAAEGMAREILENAPLAVRAMKEVAVRGLGLRYEDRLRLAQLVAGRVRASEDAQEGLDAFTEKRAPVWKGR